jgi:hypothetical protein
LLVTGARGILHVRAELQMIETSQCLDHIRRVIKGGLDLWDW